MSIGEWLLEDRLVAKLQRLRDAYRPDIRNRAAVESTQ